MQPASAYTRFIQALNVTNAALERHRDSLILRPLLLQVESRLSGVDLVVAIVASEESPIASDFVTIRWEGGAFLVVSHGRCRKHVDWVVTHDYLERLAARPREFIENPHQLDLEWLKQRVDYSPWATLDQDETARIQRKR